MFKKPFFQSMVAPSSLQQGLAPRGRSLRPRWAKPCYREDGAQELVDEMH